MYIFKEPIKCTLQCKIFNSTVNAQFNNKYLIQHQIYNSILIVKYKIYSLLNVPNAHFNYKNIIQCQIIPTIHDQKKNSISNVKFHTIQESTRYIFQYNLYTAIQNNHIKWLLYNLRVTLPYYKKYLIHCQIYSLREKQTAYLSTILEISVEVWL